MLGYIFNKKWVKEKMYLEFSATTGAKAPRTRAEPLCCHPDGAALWLLRAFPWAGLIKESNAVLTRKQPDKDEIWFSLALQRSRICFY